MGEGKIFGSSEPWRFDVEKEKKIERERGRERKREILNQGFVLIRVQRPSGPKW